MQGWIIELEQYRWQYGLDHHRLICFALLTSCGLNIKGSVALDILAEFNCGPDGGFKPIEKFRQYLMQCNRIDAWIGKTKKWGVSRSCALEDELWPTLSQFN